MARKRAICDKVNLVALQAIEATVKTNNEVKEQIEYIRKRNNSRMPQNTSKISLKNTILPEQDKNIINIRRSTPGAIQSMDVKDIPYIKKIPVKMVQQNIATPVKIEKPKILKETIVPTASSVPTLEGDAYWKNYYKKTIDKKKKPSTFATFIHNYIKDKDFKSIIDMGCGGGQDLLYFKALKYEVDGLENDDYACQYLRERHNVNVINGSVLDPVIKKYDVYYCRFVVHALRYNEINNFFTNMYNSMPNNAILCIETRSVKNTKHQHTLYKEDIFTSGTGSAHMRTLLSLRHLKDIYIKNNFVSEYCIDKKGLSIFNGEDPCLIRLVLKKNDNTRDLLKSIITPEIKRKQTLLKAFFDELCKIFETHDIKYVVYFGNLIGLLRNNSLFVPWDDDIDISMPVSEVVRLNGILDKEKYYIDFLTPGDTICRIHSTKGSGFVDVFHKHECVKYIDFNNTILIQKYKTPKNYQEYFNIFYSGKLGDILNTCVIYNHSYNNRWTTNKSDSIRIDVEECNHVIKHYNL